MIGLVIGLTPTSPGMIRMDGVIPHYRSAPILLLSETLMCMALHGLNGLGRVFTIRSIRWVPMGTGQRSTLFS